MFYKFLIVIIISISLVSCGNNYLNSVTELDYYSTKQVLTFNDKSVRYPAWNIGLRHLRNESKLRAFTAKDKEITLRIMSIVRFVVNTPEFETNIINRQLKSSNNKSAQTTSASVKVGDILDSEKVLRTVQKTLLETQIALADLHITQGYGTMGLATVPWYYPYFEDMYNEAYSNIIASGSRSAWLKFTSLYNLEDTLNAYASIGETLLHESVHNLGFTHHASVSYYGPDVPYAMGQIYAATLKDPKFLEKYKDEFKKIIPYFEEKYSEFITHEPAVKSFGEESRISDNFYAKTHSPNGEPLTIVECIIEDHERYIKPFRYVVKNGQRTTDDFILK